MSEVPRQSSDLERQAHAAKLHADLDAIMYRRSQPRFMGDAILMPDYSLTIGLPGWWP